MYTIIRYTFEGEPMIVKQGLSLREVQKHCNDPRTKGDGWFDGYEETKRVSKYLKTVMTKTYETFER